MKMTEMVGKWRNYIVIIKQFHENARSGIPTCRELSHSLVIKNDVFKHREGLKGSYVVDTIL